MLTLSTKGLSVTTHIQLEPDCNNGLKETSWVKCEQILTISKDRLTTLVGSVTAADLQRIVQRQL